MTEGMEKENCTSTVLEWVSVEQLTGTRLYLANVLVRLHCMAFFGATYNTKVYKVAIYMEKYTTFPCYTLHLKTEMRSNVTLAAASAKDILVCIFSCSMRTHCSG